MSLALVALPKRHAVKIALVYLVIRCLPDLLMYVILSLPADTIASLMETHGAWLRQVRPVMPLQLLSVPVGFQQALALLPALTLEVLCVFLFSAWFLRRQPAAACGTNSANSTSEANRPGKRRWIILILATVIWSCVVRHQLLAYLQGIGIAELRAHRNDADFTDLLPGLLSKSYWTLTAVIYATAPLWAWLPTWLHFRSAKQSAGARAAVAVPAEGSDRDDTRDTQHTQHIQDAHGIVTPLHRATVFASFLLGCLVVHLALVHALFTGLWPWVASLTRTSVPPDLLKTLALPLALSQVVVPSLICALAAYVYARRPNIGTASVGGPFVKPALAGIGAYLLTALLLLAGAWLVAWLNPDVAVSLQRRLARAPESGIALTIGLNIAAVLLLCAMSQGLRQSPRRWSAVLAALLVCAAIPTYVGWTLAGSNMGLAGGRPGAAITGVLGDAHWRSMQQWCTGVVDTRQGTWLIARNEDALGAAAYIPEGVPDLSRLVNPDDGTQARRRGLFGSSPLVTTLARLQDDGKFKLMAAIPELACLVVSPESDTLYLLTDVKRPDAAPSLNTADQTAVFRSRDQGATWEWLKAGFMVEAGQFASGIKPTFRADKEVWAWGNEPAGEDEPASAWGIPVPVPTRRGLDGTEQQPTALFYSQDQGATTTVIYSPAPLVAPISYLREMTGQADANFTGRRDMDRQRFVVQLDDKRAYAWATEFTWYRVGEAGRKLLLTTRATLSRTSPDEPWRVTQVVRQPGVRIEHLSTSVDGRTHAVLEDKDGEWLARLDADSGEWVERQRTPSVLPTWLAEDETSTRYFWSNGDYQVVSQWGYVHVSRLLIPVSKARVEINTDAHFYTRDGGRSWHQLAIPGYLGVMGLSPHGSKLYWNRGNWYSDQEPVQREYDLAK